MPLSCVRVVIVDPLAGRDVVDAVRMAVEGCGCRVVVGEDILSLVERYCLEEGCENTLVVAAGRPSVYHVWQEHGFLKVLDVTSCGSVEGVVDTVRDKCCCGGVKLENLCFVESGPGWLEL
ncbi:MAG TPA: hypothetical protein EYH08_01800 [Pyrodictium sp.]|nr:hypothetical protein [Pyrodictium sp.]